MAEEETALRYQKMKGMAQGSKGFHLAIVKLEEVNSLTLDSSLV